MDKTGLLFTMAKHVLSHRSAFLYSFSVVCLCVYSAVPFTVCMFPWSAYIPKFPVQNGFHLSCLLAVLVEWLRPGVM